MAAARATGRFSPSSSRAVAMRERASSRHSNCTATWPTSVTCAASSSGLPDSPWYERDTKYGRGKGYGSVLSFIIKGGRDAGTRFVEALELHSHVANIGDVRSLVIQPATTTHSQLTEEEQASTGVYPGLVRLSVGLESIEDILADLDAGF